MKSESMQSKLSDDSNSVSVPASSVNMASQFASRLLSTPQSWSARQDKHESERMWRVWAADVRTDYKFVNYKSLFPYFPAYTVMAVRLPWHSQGRSSESTTQALKVEPGQNKSVLRFSHGIVGLATHNQGLLSTMRRATRTQTYTQTGLQSRHHDK